MAYKSRKKKKNNQNKNMIIVLAAVVLVVFGAVIISNQNQPATSTAALPLEVNVRDTFAFYERGGYILDVRTPEEWAAGHVPGATLIPLDELSNRLSELPQDEDIYIICRSGNRSASARDILLQNGFEQVTSVGGGFNNWSANGYPVETGP